MRTLSYLAFAAGYRRVSFVLIENGQLATWHTSKKAARSPDEATRFAAEFIDLLMPNVIVVEDVEARSRKGENTRVLVRAIREEANCSNSSVIALEREHLFRTRHDEATWLVTHYPELADKIPTRLQHEPEPYHSVLFDALALAHQAMQGSTLLLASKM